MRQTVRVSDQPVLVRPARLGDGDRVWPLARDFATSFTPERAAFDDTWAQLVDVPGTLLLVAEAADGSVVGYLLGSWRSRAAGQARSTRPSPTKTPQSSSRKP